MNFSCRAAALGGALAALSSCQSPAPAPQSFADLHFSEAALRLDVARVEVLDRYHPVLDPPHMEERLPVPLPHALENWGRERFQAVGSRGSAIVTIEDAAATAAPVAKQQGFSAQFTTQADTRYELHVAVTVEIRDERGFAVRTADAKADHSYTALEDATLDQRDRELYRIEMQIMAELDRQITGEIEAGFNPYLQ